MIDKKEMHGIWNRVVAMSLSMALVVSGTPTIGFADEVGSEQGEETPAVVNDEPSDSPSQGTDNSDQQPVEIDVPSNEQPPAEEVPDQGQTQEPSQDQPQAPDQSQNQDDTSNDNQGEDAQNGSSNSSSASNSSSSASQGSNASSSGTESADSEGDDEGDDKTDGLLRSDNSDIYASCRLTAYYLVKQRLGIDIDGMKILVWDESELPLCCDGKYKVGGPGEAKANSLALWLPNKNNSSPHVAFVDAVSADGKTMDITEGGWHKGGDYSKTGTLHTATVKTSGSEYGEQYGGELAGFIYLLEPVNSSSKPSGKLQSVEASAGAVKVTGVAYNPKSSDSTAKVQVYAGDAESGTKIGSLTTDSSGSFSKKFTISQRGKITFHAYVLDDAGKQYELSEAKECRVTEPKGDAVTSLAEGKYAIRSRLDASMSLTVKDASKKNCANVQVNSWAGKTNQIFNVTKNSNGTYSLTAVHSGQAVEVRKNSVADGANISQYPIKEDGVQSGKRWWMDKNSDGTYTLRNQNSGKVMAIKESKAEDGTNVQQSTGKGWKRQMWYFVPIDVSKWSVKAADVEVDGELSGAVTTTVTVKAGGAKLKAGTDYSVVYQNNSAAGTAAVTIIGKNGFSGMQTVTFNITENLEGSLSSSKPSWKGPSSIPVGSVCSFTVKNGTIKVTSGKDCVTVIGSYIQAKKKGTVGLALLDSDGNEVATKALKIVELSGNYEIQTALNSKYVLDIQKGSKENSANMIVYTRTGKNNQRFKFEKQSDGTYAIKCVHSGKYLDVQGGSSKEGKNVIQYTSNGKANQHWLIQVDAKGRVTFASANSGLCFNVNGDKAVKGRKINQMSANSGKSQKWVLNQD